jgi:hypothetical protein
MQYGLQDANLIATGALPNGAAAILSSSIDMGNSTFADVEFRGEFVLTAPALTVGQLANAATMTYDIIMASNAALTAGVQTIYPGVLVQTGAGGAGAAGNTFRFKLPEEPGGAGATLRYIGFRATNSGAGNASPVSGTLAINF